MVQSNSNVNASIMKNGSQQHTYPPFEFKLQY